MQVELSPKARAQLKDLSRDASLRRRLLNALEGLAKTPLAGKPLKGPLQGVRSYRVGTYRILYEVFRDRLVVYVLDIRHRGDVYRRTQ